MTNSALRIKKLLAVTAFGVLCIAPNMAAFANVNVRGHYRQNGTYVRPHYRTNPNRSIYDNWSTKGNTNPYTGQKGYKRYRY